MNIHFDTVSTAVAYYINLRAGWLPIRALSDLAILLGMERMLQVSNYLGQYVKSKLDKEDMDFLFEYINKEEHTERDKEYEDYIIFHKIDVHLKTAFMVDPLKARGMKYGGILYPGIGQFIDKSLSDKEQSYSLAQLQKWVGGYTQIVRLSDELMMIVDEDGKLKDQPINYAATLLAKSYGAIYDNDFIVGKAFICYSKYIK